MSARSWWGWLRGIQVSANAIRDEQLGRIRVAVTSAYALTGDQQKSIAAKLGQTLGKRSVLKKRSILACSVGF